MTTAPPQRWVAYAGPVVNAIGWPAVVLALGAATLPLAGELSSPCGASGSRAGLWAATGVLCLVMFALSAARVFVGRSPWPVIDRIGTVLLVAALGWAGVRGVLLVFIAAAFSVPAQLPWFGTSGRVVLAAPALIPLLIPVAAIGVTRLTEGGPPGRRLWALAGITVGLPLVVVVGGEALSASLCAVSKPF